ncbi:hypothetical protein [Couchioplanes azureus]|uniref:hypothetical protein n=1 Tax=Couchioplanes caeruleus TaxID=56438 RepID=UPI0016709109|nr:hypothetical protein [Couchioplanes caeruleus]GGQ71465.1 hypothetical protein GCM10010166_47000 [Couchioplanes caeruleus subsp. azureus]
MGDAPGRYRARNEITFASESHYPESVESPVIVICDFEVKHADVVGLVAGELRERHPGAELYFAVFGIMTKGESLEVDGFDDLTGSTIMQAAKFEAVFIAATMSPPGIEPPLSFAEQIERLRWTRPTTSPISQPGSPRRYAV